MRKVDEGRAVGGADSCRSRRRTKLLLVRTAGFRRGGRIGGGVIRRGLEMGRSWLPSSRITLSQAAIKTKRTSTILQLFSTALTFC